jgi:multidrug efflux pump subunit AcrA (membrane-fusion protein)
VDGRVKEIRVNVGDAANKNDTLMLLEGIEEG